MPQNEENLFDLIDKRMILDKDLCKKTGVKKNAIAHLLRHSFTTYLLDDEMNLRYIQELLGHKSSKTTEAYTHVSNRELRKLQ